MNVGIILAAGKSTRFGQDVPKQLYHIDGKPIIEHSINILEKFVDDIIIVTNSDCKDKISGKVVVNDKDSRIESISKGLNQILDCENVLIHDAARPYITEKMIEELMESSQKNLHSQFYLPLINGLAKINGSSWNIPDRNDFIELCSPQITNYRVFKDIFYNYILTGEECEVLPVLSRFLFKYNLIKGHWRYLRKVTTLEDIF